MKVETSIALIEAMKASQPNLSTTEDEIRNMLIAIYGRWHGCALKKPERGLKKGTLCDVCLDEIRVCPGPNCSMCNGEYCAQHFAGPCDCDVIDRHQARIDAAKQEQRHNDYQDEIYLKSLNDLDAAKEKEKRNE